MCDSYFHCKYTFYLSIIVGNASFFITFYYLFITFVAMELSIKRSVSAWLLLAVFLPALIVSSVHVHKDGHEEETECKQCTHHKVHSSHIAKTHLVMHDCLLCQILHLTFLPSSSTITLCPVRRIVALAPAWEQSVADRATAIHAPRAPPLF